MLTVLLLVASSTAEPTISLEHRVQFWSLMTFDARIDPDGQGDLARVEPRPDLFVRRGRLSLKLRPAPRHQLRLQLQYDGLAQDPGTLGLATPPKLSVEVRDAFWSWNLHQDSLVLTLGYFHVQLSREAIIGGFSLNSFEKSPLSSIVREHISGRLSGREAGVNLGGLLGSESLGLQWDLGVYDPTASSIVGEGLLWSPLLSARAALSFGAREGPRYALGYAGQLFGKRRGVTIALNGAWQGRTSRFESNGFLGADLSLHLGPLAVAAEFDLLQRDAPARRRERVWMFRAAYAFALGEERFLQPVLTLTRLEGERGSGLGTLRSVEGSLVLFLSETLRVSLCYTWLDGTSPSVYSDGLSFQQSPWIGLGLQHVLDVHTKP